mgnify:CR=1 FL=1
MSKKTANLLEKAKLQQRIQLDDSSQFRIDPQFHESKLVSLVLSQMMSFPAAGQTCIYYN